MRIEHTRQRYDQTHDLREQGQSMRAIARKHTVTSTPPSTAVLINEITPATDGVAARLSIRPGTPVLHLRRSRLAEGMKPLAILENYLPEDLIGIGDTDLAAGGLYQMRAHGINIRVAKQRIGARKATPEESQLLGERKGQPVLSMERAAHDDTGRTVECSQHAYRASRYTFEVTLVAH